MPKLNLSKIFQVPPWNDVTNVAEAISANQAKDDTTVWCKLNFLPRMMELLSLIFQILNPNSKFLNDILFFLFCLQFFGHT